MIHYLKSPSEIVSEEDKGNVWRLEFIYDGKSRQLIHYRDINYFDQEWPKEIKELSHIIGIGSTDFECLYKNSEDCNDSFHTGESHNLFKKMVKERTKDVFTLSGGNNCHYYFPIQRYLKHGIYRNSGWISSYIVEDKTKEDWFVLC
jgi:hypothetical protein